MCLHYAKRLVINHVDPLTVGQLIWMSGQPKNTISLRAPPSMFLIESFLIRKTVTCSMTYIFAYIINFGSIPKLRHTIWKYFDLN